MNIYLTIKQICDSKGITINDLEQTLGLGKRSLYNWQRSSPSIDSVIKVADYFNVSVDSLLGRCISAPAPSISPEARSVALAYDSADEDTRFVVRHSLGLTQKKPASLPG